MSTRQYPSPLAFKQALEQRLRSAAPNGLALARTRQRLVFDRFLARVVQELGDAALLKGGLVLELRLQQARTTRDVDLRVSGSSDTILQQLQTAARLDLGDFLQFQVVPDPHHAEIQNDGLQYEGLRFRAECRLAGKIYGQHFGVDVVFGDPIHGEPDTVTANDFLGFIGISPPKIPLYPVETHIAEKLHAYTMPRERPNSRVKDLPDIALLSTIRKIASVKLLAALEQTFSFRKTHPLPAELPEPSPHWEAPYAAMASTNELEWTTLADVLRATQAFLNPVLASNTDAIWEPTAQSWQTNDEREPWETTQ